VNEETPATILRQWAKENHNSGIRLAVCNRMAESPDMAAAWPSLLSAGAKPLHVFSLVLICLDEAESDIRRLPSKEELRSIDEVRSAASNLLAALQGAQFLNETAPFIELGEHPAILAWTDYRARILEKQSSHHGDFATVSLPDLLRHLTERCKEIVETPPPNAIQRQTNGKERSFVRAFIRRMGVQFRFHFKAEMPENLARITHAVLQLEEPLTGREVDKILSDSPLGTNL